MNRIGQKLKDNSGSSIILALGLFLICATVSAIILAASAEGSSRNVKRSVQQRAYFSVSSAAQLTAEELELAVAYVGREEAPDYGCDELNLANTVYESHEPGICYDNPDPTKKTDNSRTEMGGVLADLLKYAAGEIYLQNQESVTVEFTITAADETLYDVNCTFYMDKDYNVTIDFDTEGSNYAVRISAAAILEEPVVVTVNEDNRDVDGDADTVLPVCTHTVTKKETLADGSIVTAPNFTLNVVGSITYTYTSVSWQPPVIQKGSK